VIRIRRHSGVSLLEGALEPGLRGYMDAEWLGATQGDEVPVMTVDPEGALRFGRHTWSALAGADADRAAYLAFSTLARRAVDALPEPGPGVVGVTGTGIVAAEVRRLLGAAAASGPEAGRPEAVIDTTGDPDAIADATRRLADGGVLVLAGESGGRRTDINLYPNVHVRGLWVVGAGPLLSQSPAAGDSNEGRDPGDSLAAVSFGKPLPSAKWYRIETSGAAECVG
jgi:hypothetical protein